MATPDGDPPPALQGTPRRIVDVLWRGGPATRADVAAATGLSRASVSSALAGLIDSGLVVETGEAAPTRPSGGRPATVVRLGPRAGLAVGVDIGRRHIRVAVADLGHEVRMRAAQRLEPHLEATTVLARAATMVESVVNDAGFSCIDVVGIGLGLPGPIDSRSGTVASPNLLPEWEGVTAGPILAERLRRPVLTENDANLGALSEHLWGAGRGCDTIAYVKVATGIGGGLVINGRLHRGAGGTAGEIGHITLDENGALCRCGSRGCLEVVASGAALVANVQRAMPEIDAVEDLVRLAQRGDSGCARMIADAGRHLGVAIGTVVNLVNPERVVVGGELGQAGDLLLGPMRQALLWSTVLPGAGHVEVVPGQLGDHSEVLGGVALVLREPDSLHLAESALAG